MEHITNLNRKRNQRIISQAKEINMLLLEHSIVAVFLKGTGNLLDGLYYDVAERMVGDIDFIVSQEDYEDTINILKHNRYRVFKESDIKKTFHWHYPALVHPEKIAAVEVHNKILKKPFDDLLSYEIIKKDLIKKATFHFLSNSNKLLNALLPKIINDHLYYSQNISLRTMYDVFLITKKKSYEIDIKNKVILKKINNFLGCIKMVLNYPETIRVEESKRLQKFKKSYLARLDKSKKEKLKYDIIDYLTKYQEKIYILKMAFYNKEYKNYVLKKIVEMDFYKRLFGFKPTD
jgi:hypothetical protein